MKIQLTVSASEIKGFNNTEITHPKLNPSDLNTMYAENFLGIDYSPQIFQNLGSVFVFLSFLNIISVNFFRKCSTFSWNGCPSNIGFWRYIFSKAFISCILRILLLNLYERVVLNTHSFLPIEVIIRSRRYKIFLRSVTMHMVHLQLIWRSKQIVHIQLEVQLLLHNDEWKMWMLAKVEEMSKGPPFGFFGTLRPFPWFSKVRTNTRFLVDAKHFASKEGECPLEVFRHNATYWTCIFKWKF